MGSTLNFYYNGEPDGTFEYKDTLVDSNEPVRVGRTDRDDFIFGGIIDEVKLYNRALSAQEIKDEAIKTYSVESIGKLVPYGVRFGKIVGTRLRCLYV